jgi:hypothetical protein
MFRTPQLNRISWLTGPAVDSVLASCGALAAAVNSRTILVSSRLAAKPIKQQDEVLANELATACLFSDAGEDLDGLLEAEAFAASRAMMPAATAALPLR